MRNQQPPLFVTVISHFKKQNIKQSLVAVQKCIFATQLREAPMAYDKCLPPLNFYFKKEIKNTESNFYISLINNDTLKKFDSVFLLKKTHLFKSDKIFLNN